MTRISFVYLIVSVTLTTAAQSFAQEPAAAEGSQEASGRAGESLPADSDSETIHKQSDSSVVQEVTDVSTLNETETTAPKEHEDTNVSSPTVPASVESDTKSSSEPAAQTSVTSADVSLSSRSIETDVKPVKNRREALTPPDANWSVGVGFSVFLYTASTSALGSIYHFAWSPTAILGLERRLYESLFLVFDLRGSYARDTETDDDLELTHKSASAGAEIGIRPIFNPGSFVEVSAVVSFGGGWYYSLSPGRDWIDGELYGLENDYIQYDETSSGIYLGGAIGIVLEKELMRNLFVRIQCRLFDVSYSTETESSIEVIEAVGETETGGTSYILRTDSVESESSGVRAGLALSPSLQLRMQF